MDALCRCGWMDALYIRVVGWMRYVEVVCWMR